MKKKKNLRRVLFLVLGVVIIVGATIILSKSLNGNQITEEEKDMMTIDNYDYVLTGGERQVYKDMFAILKETLENEELNEEMYAQTIAKMFAFDYYNLEDKLSKNDIGGVAFIYPTSRTNFIDESVDTVYKYVETNFDGKRDEKLPEITAVEMTATENTSFTYTKDTIVDGVKKSEKAIDDKAYLIRIAITYKEELGYPKAITLKLVHEDKYLYIVEVK